MPPVSEEGNGTKPEVNVEELHYGNFPTGFLFGSSSIAHQVEGTSDGDGKGQSTWDEFSQSHPKCIADRTTANETCDSYNKFEDDVIMLKYLNANAYSFTISWSRILPEGLPTRINKKGIAYYNDLINTLIENGIEPIVTLYHWDLPLPLMQKFAGGWMNEQLIRAFVEYSRICFEAFGDRVQYFVTLAQPWQHCWESYGSGMHPPHLCLGNKGAFVANTNMLKAHAQVYRLYESRFKPVQSGQVGISFSCSADNKGASYHEQFARVLHPLTYGEYPESVTSDPGVKECLCVHMSEEWKSCLKGAFDFLNLHFSHEISTTTSLIDVRDTKLLSPVTLQTILKKIKVDFGNPDMFVSCKGPTLASPSQMMDIDRAQYFSLIASDILKAIDLSECNVRGFFPGKLMDCWEWESGFTTSYGLFHVDIFHPSKKRSPRASVAFMLKQLFKEKKLQDVFPL